jgi:hypothetical protein
MEKALIIATVHVPAIQDIGDLTAPVFPRTATMGLITVTERVHAFLDGEIQIVHVKHVQLIVMAEELVIAMELAPVMLASGDRIAVVLQQIVIAKV